MTTTEPKLLHPLVTRVFAELGVETRDPGDLTERMLVQDEFYVGHRFLLGEWSAVWYTESDTIDFFDPTGTRMRSCSVEGTEAQAQPLRRAA